MKHIIFILFLAAGSLQAQCKCKNRVIDTNHVESTREFIAGNTHTRLYLRMVHEDTQRYFQGEIYQSRSGGSFFNVFEGQELLIKFRDSSSITVKISVLYHSDKGQHAVEDTRYDYFGLVVPPSVMETFQARDILEIVIINKKGVERKEPETLNTYKKYKSSKMFGKWICCLQDKREPR
jgi:hypothetical protein